MRFVIFLTLFSLSLVADESKFDEANQLYEQGDFESSISKYHSLLESGAQTSAVHFNLGNAYFRQNNTGLAIYHYLMAQSLDPLDADIQANLKFTRESAGLPSGGISSTWRNLVRVLPLNAWFILATLPLWTFCLLKTLNLFAATEKLKGVQYLMGWLIMPGICILALMAWTVSSHHQGVVIRDKASLHASPFSDSKVLGELKAGEEVLLLASKDDWRQIKKRDGESGWLELSQLKTIPVH